MSLQSALIGFLVSRMFKTPLSPQENVLIQATAAATGTVRLIFEGSFGILIAQWDMVDAAYGRFRGHHPCAGATG